MILAIGIKAESLNSILGLIFELIRKRRLTSQQLGMIGCIGFELVHVDDELGCLGVLFLSSIGLVHDCAQQSRFDRCSAGRLQTTAQTQQRDDRQTD